MPGADSRLKAFYQELDLMAKEQSRRKARKTTQHKNSESEFTNLPTAEGTQEPVICWYTRSTSAQVNIGDSVTRSLQMRYVDLD